jgi:hypothetical protein
MSVQVVQESLGETWMPPGTKSVVARKPLEVQLQHRTRALSKYSEAAGVTYEDDESLDIVEKMESAIAGVGNSIPPLLKTIRIEIVEVFSKAFLDLPSILTACRVALEV